MPKFKITTSLPAVYYYYYEVEAETQEEAEKLVMDGEVESITGAIDMSCNSEEIIESEAVVN
jgi:hypothetical protein